MLTLAVGLTLVGFVLLVFALLQANFALAIACIAVCVVGLVILLVDTVRTGRRGRGGTDDEPLFTIRGRESTSRVAPLHDDENTVDRAEADPATSVAADADPTGEPAIAETAAVEVPPMASSGLGSLVSPQAHGNAVGEPPAVEDEIVEETGDANDYIKSVTGSFPAQTPSGSFGAIGGVDSESLLPRATVDEGASAEYVGRRRVQESENVIVTTPDAELPAMKLVYGDPLDPSTPLVPDTDEADEDEDG